ncbi:CHAT domain-containing protein [Mycena capillaripes]|nr:CHAT domain-containing protein [Mycena capillaripes]
MQQLINQTPSGHPDLAQYYQELGNALGLRYLKAGDSGDLEGALQNTQDALRLTPMDHPDRARCLGSLASSLTYHYWSQGDVNDLNAALQAEQEAVELIPTNHPDLAKHLCTLATCFGERYRRLGNLKDLEITVQKFQEGVDLTPEIHPNRAERLQNLSVFLGDRYQRLGELNDLDAAIQRAEEAVKLNITDNPDHSRHLYGLAVCIGQRYRRFGDLKDLKAAVLKFQEAVDLTPTDHTYRAEHLQGLAVSLSDQYQRFGDLQDLEAGVQRRKEALDLTLPNDPDYPRRLYSLAVSFAERYQRLGEVGDLEASVQKYQTAVDLTPANHPLRRERLQNLALILRDRYQRFADLKDLEASLQKIQEAVSLTPGNHPELAQYLQNLSICLGDRYQRLGDLKDLKAAVHYDQQAVKLTPADHLDRAGRLQNLAVMLRALYQRLGDLRDLKAALATDQEAINLIPVNHSNRARYLHSLAISFGYYYQRSGNLADLEAAVQNFQEVVDLTSAENPKCAIYLDSLAAAFGNQYKSLEIQPVVAPTAYVAAFRLLPELLWLGNTLSVRHDAICWLDLGPVTSAAARTCIKLSHLKSAVEILEQGVATSFQQMLQLKTEDPGLPPEQAEELQKLSSELYSGTARNLTDVAIKRGELLAKIRKQAGFQHFLLPKPYSVLAQASKGGPIIILNSHEDGCDGIILLNPSSEPVHVAFSSIKLEDLQSQRDMLKELLGRCGVRTREDSVSSRLFGRQEKFTSKTTAECFTDLLSWLYMNVVDPTYQHGICTGRLWWLPIGLFTGLPLHASAPTDPFIPSYTATLGSLLEAQAKKSSSSHKVGIVGVTHTGPGRKNYLKGVEQEVKNICSVIKGFGLECLDGRQATPNAVKHQLQDCSWVHLACHGTQDVVNPTKSRLLLYEGYLELETILQMPLSNAEFVFLAACQTAMGDTELVNESFHLGGGFIAAGFQSAVGTLWSMSDQDGPLVAEVFYANLFRNGKNPQASDTAQALQFSVKELKAQNVPYERWIPFIHMGI